MEHDAWFFIGIFVFIFVIWIATGGPIRPLSVTTPEFPKPTAFNTGTAISLPRAPFNVGDSHVTLRPVSGMSGNSYGDTTTPPPSVIDGIAFGPPSSYRNTVILNPYVTSASSSNPNREYLQLSVPQNAGLSIDISGWQLVSEVTGKYGVIPRGTTVPTSGIVNPQQNIVLKPGERAALVSGRSPIGTSFRENKCTGYFMTFQEFSPALPRNCPLPSDELEKYYGGFYARDTKCMDYVNTIGRCEAVLFPPRDISKQCRSFVLEHLNYNGCVRAHQNDPDFHGSTWHIYLGATKPLWRARQEIIKLLDPSRKTVDAFSY